MLSQLINHIKRSNFLNKIGKRFILYITSEEVLSMLPHELLDFSYFRLRRHIHTRFDWRRNPNRSQIIFTDFMKRITKYISIRDKSILDLGSGKTNPLGLSILFYLNGCRNVYAYDMEEFDHERSAAALYELLLDCFAFPQKWLQSDISKKIYFERLTLIDMNTLKKNDMKNILESQPLSLIRSDINKVKLDKENIDIIFSQAVLEHLMDFEKTMKTLYNIMSPGGIMIHHVDFRDHRMFSNPGKFYWWSFLEEDQCAPDPLCNRLRPCQMKEIMERTGFKVVEFEGKRENLTHNIYKRISDSYSNMSKEDITTTNGTFTVLKPH